MKISNSVCWVLWVLLVAIGCRTAAQADRNVASDEELSEERAVVSQEIGQFKDNAILECSGISASGNHKDHYWVHNDSGDDPVAFLIDQSGTIKGKFELDKVSNKDFEDCATFQLKGESYLAIGDIGNNRRNRNVLKIYLFKEPKTLLDRDSDKRRKRKLAPITTIEFKYEDGVNRDSESLAFLPKSQQFVLSSKISTRELLNSASAELFTIDFDIDKGRQSSVAKRIGKIPGGMNTAMDISPDGRFLVVRNYIYAYLFNIEKTGLQLDVKQSQRINLPVQQQGEAICFSNDGNKLIVTSEGKRQKIFALGLR